MLHHSAGQSERPGSTLSVVIQVTRSSRDPGQYQFLILGGAGPLSGAPGRIERQVRLEELEAIRHGLDQALRAYRELAAVVKNLPPPDPGPIVTLGRRVAQLLPPLVQQAIILSAQRARRQQRRLRLILQMDREARHLHAVPWELLLLPLQSGAAGDPGGERFLLHDGRVSLIRQVRGVGQHLDATLPATFAVQSFAASPLDAEPINVAATRQIIAQMAVNSPMRSSWYEGPDTMGALRERLRATGPHILHLLCHGEQSDTGHELRHDLLFVHRDGSMRRVSPYDLVPAISVAPTLQIVILQACHSGSAQRAMSPREDERLVLEGFALALVRAGVAVVIAMQGSVGEQAAAMFARGLFAVLRDGGGVDEAVAAGRLAMLDADSAADWMLPVVYQGSGLPYYPAWHHRLADQTAAALLGPAARLSLRATFAVWGLGLLIVALLRWLVAPSMISLAAHRLAEPALALTALGLVGPAMIATASRPPGAADLKDLSVWRAMRRGQWAGAYLGYALGEMLTIAVSISLWALGMALSVWSAPILGAGMACSLWCSYVVARSQARSAQAIAPVEASLYSRATVLIMIAAAATLMIAPLALLWIAESSAAQLLTPTVLTFLLGMLLFSLVLWAGHG